MRWVRLPVSIADDPRTFDLAGRLRCSHAEAVGVVALLLAHAGRIESDTLGTGDAKRLAAAARLPGRADRTVDALLAVGFLSRCNGVTDDASGPHFDQFRLDFGSISESVTALQASRETTRHRVARFRETRKRQGGSADSTASSEPRGNAVTVTAVTLLDKRREKRTGVRRPIGGEPPVNDSTSVGTNARTAAAAAPLSGSAASSARAVTENEPTPPAARLTSTGETAPEPRPAPLPLPCAVPVAAPLPEPEPSPEPSPADDDDDGEPPFLASYRKRAAEAAASGDHANARRWTERADRWRLRAAEADGGAEA